MTVACYIAYIVMEILRRLHGGIAYTMIDILRRVCSKAVALWYSISYDGSSKVVADGVCIARLRYIL